MDSSPKQQGAVDTSPTYTKDENGKWVSLEQEHKFKFDFALPPLQLPPNAVQLVMPSIDWSKVVGVQRSSAGSVGVFFVHLKHEGTDRAVVIKASSDLAGELFSTMLALKLGIPAPFVKVVSRASDEGKALYQRCLDVHTNPVEVESVLCKKTILIREYLQGKTLDSIRSEAFRDCINLPLRRESLLRQVGEVAAFDLLLNNIDRMPLAADNRGNPANIMLDCEQGRLIALDNGICSINKENVASYLDKCAGILRSIFVAQEKFPDMADAHTKYLQEVLEGWTGICLGDDSFKYIREGLLDLVSRAGQLKTSTLMEMKADLEAFDPDMIGLHTIQDYFLEAMLLLFREVPLHDVSGEEILEKALQNLDEHDASAT